MTQDIDLKYKVIKSIAWLGGLKYVGQVFSWGITIIVIRILDPSDYGLMAMASVCVNFMVMMSELGLGAAIIQRKEISQDQLSKVFGFIILSHFFLFLALLLGAHVIAVYFSEPKLVPILQVLSVNFLLLSLYVIPQSLLIRRMDFQKKSIIDLSATVLSSSITLTLAIYGYGVWSLIVGSISGHIIFLLGYNLMVKNFLLPKFKLKGVRDFFSFGSYIVGSRILWYFYYRSDILIGGRILGNHLLGIYSVALEISSIPLEKTFPIINQIAFPAYSSIQSDMKLVCSHFLKAARISSLVFFPAFWGLLIIAPELFGWLLGKKWVDVILPMQLLCLILPFRAMGNLFSPMLLGIGRPEINFYYVAFAAIIMPVSFLIGVKYGVVGICLAWVLGYTIVFFFTLIISLRIINLTLSDYFSNIIIAPLASFIMMFMVFCAKYLKHYSISQPLLACFMIFIGIITYTLLIYLFKRDTFNEVLSLIPGNSRY